MLESTETKYAIIGAGPAGLCAAKNCVQMNIPFVGFEIHSNVGGIWDIESKTSTVYESAHLISSKGTTQLRELPMAKEVADYPSHVEVKRYFQQIAEKFGLYEHYQFNTKVISVEPEDGKWRVTVSKAAGKDSYLFKGVMIANGTLHEPLMPSLEGEFNGELIHSCEYKSPEIFDGKRVLIVGAGNSGCDIAVDAVHRAQKVDLSLRRGYHFVPKFVFGKPADTVGGFIKFPYKIKQRIDSLLLKIFIGNPQRLGIPKPDHKLYDLHPIVNSLVLYHLGHGDIEVRPDVKGFEGPVVIFSDKRQQEYDVVLLATGYKLNFPFIDSKHLNWPGATPSLYLNAFHPEYDNFFVVGMVEAAGIGWQGRDDQARLICTFIKAKGNPALSKTNFARQRKKGRNNMRGSATYLNVDRMAYYVNKDVYLKQLKANEKELKALIS